jgi:hypothetical protein
MSRRNRKYRYQDKIVIGLTSSENYLKNIKTLESHDYASNIIETILTKKNVITNRVFIGGDKEDLKAFLSNIIWNFQLSDIYIDDDSEYYVDDPDFD